MRRFFVLRLGVLGVLGVLGMLGILGKDVLAHEQEVVDCFDYYEFQQIDMSFPVTGKSQAEALPGETLTLVGTVENKTQVTVPQGQIKYRLVEVTADEKLRRTQGDRIYDQGVLLSDIHLLPSEKKSLQATYQLPKLLSGGDYRLNFFFIQNNQFNWAGLYFTDDIIGSFLPLTVKAPDLNLPFFDRGKTEVNGEKHNHIGFISNPVEMGEKIDFKTVLVNPAYTPHTGTITTKLYYWDQQDVRRLLDTRRAEVSLPPVSERELVYTVAAAEESVYLLEQTFAASSTTDVLSYKNIVFTRVGTTGAKGRLNSLGLSHFPVKTGEQAAFYVCYHNTSDAVFQGKVKAELRDGQETFLASLEYEGEIPGPIQAVKKDVTFNYVPSQLVLSAQIHDQQGKLVDKAEIKYDCEKFGNRCPLPPQTAGGEAVQDKGGSVSAPSEPPLLTKPLFLLAGITLIAIIATAGIVVVVVRGSRKK